MCSLKSFCVSSDKLAYGLALLIPVRSEESILLLTSPRWTRSLLASRFCVCADVVVRIGIKVRIRVKVRIIDFIELINNKK